MQKLKVVPVGDKILVKQIEKKEEVLPSGIIEAASANAELSEGQVASVSANLTDIFREGDTVLYPSRSGVGQLIGGVAYKWLRIDEVWGVIENHKAPVG